jgi:hypothetical protein
LAQIPTLVRQILVPILQPAVEAVLAAVPALLDSHADINVGVVYHEMSTTTTSASSVLATASVADTALVLAPVDPFR